MPLFVYRCAVCGKETEKLYPSVERAALAIISSHVADHPEGFCTQTRVQAAANFALKGAGFHAVDYKGIK